MVGVFKNLCCLMKIDPWEVCDDYISVLLACYRETRY